MRRVAAAIALLCLVFPAHAEEWRIELTVDELVEIQRFVPKACCWTNNCCFGVPASEIQPQQNDSWRVTATGQFIKRTGWTEIAKNIRCACDQIDGQWVVHRHAHTRCVFPIMQSARK